MLRKGIKYAVVIKVLMILMYFQFSEVSCAEVRDVVKKLRNSKTKAELCSTSSKST